ncbi:N-acetylmuramoyl-L-alanine amidase [Corynebacterium hadale]|uniref:N-acetylmuramoyl-L-alanine amidase n=1 Tax=Corynebacterium hadale TaxID=2026255 RepID=UPI000BAA9115|nr:N-acetylmuramoyl-L-alanine amidase [Corynebacterium hadale]PAT12826.1 hypothetical protein CKJ83_06075 [Corynebacterium hadale]
MQQRKRLNPAPTRTSPLLTTTVAAILTVAVVAAGAFGGNHILNVQSVGGADAEIYSDTASFDTGNNTTVDDAAVKTQGGDSQARRVVKEFSRDREFNLFGLTWKGDRDIVAYVRSQKADGSWTEWFEMDHADNAQGETNGTEPIFVESTKRIQVSTGNVDLLDEGRTDSAAPTTAKDLQAVFLDGGSGNANPIAPAADSYTRGMPKVITRSQWGAGASSNPTYTEPVTAATVHHTAGSNSYSEAEAPGIVRGIWQYHARNLGWGDIGYNALVDKYGNIYEGRAGGLDRAVEGAHVGGFNQNTWGVSMLGDYETASPTEAAINAMGEIIGWKAAVAGFDPMGSDYHYADFSFPGSRYPAGQGAMFPNINAHRDFHYNACPGQNLYNRMGDIRRIANRKYDSLKGSTGLDSILNPSKPSNNGGIDNGLPDNANPDVEATDTTVGDLSSALGSSDADTETVTNPDGTTTTVVRPNGNAQKAKSNVSLEGLAAGDAVAIAAAAGTLAGLVILYANSRGLLPGATKSVAGMEIIPGLTVQQLTPYIGPALQAVGKQDLADVWYQFEPTLGAITAGVGGPQVGGREYAFFQKGIGVKDRQGQIYTLAGKVADAWLQQGMDAGPLGMPLSQERTLGDGTVQVTFQGGAISYNPATNAVSITTN